MKYLKAAASGYLIGAAIVYALGLIAGYAVVVVSLIAFGEMPDLWTWFRIISALAWGAGAPVVAIAHCIATAED